MKLLLLTEYFPESEEQITGGVESRAYYLVEELRKNNKITVICSRQKGQKKITKKNNLTIIRTGMLPYSASGNLFRRFAHQIYSVNKGKKIVFDHVHGMSFLHYNTSWLLGKIKKKPCSITYHECWINEWRKIKPGITGIMGELSERISVKLKHDKIISVSEFTRKQLKKKTKLDSVVVHNGIPIEKFYSTEKKDYLITVSRLMPKKNIDLVIKAVNDEELRIVGEGPEEKKLKKLAKGKNVKFLGRINNKELRKQLAEARIYVNASTLEGFGIGVIEAAASNTPYVVSDIEPFKEVTQQGKGGYIFKQQNLKDLKEKIQQAKKEEIKKEELKELSKEYDWKQISKKFKKEIR